MNPISPELEIGTIGELLVQLRLLQYKVQSAPPLKDSGNDLIAIKGPIIKTIQVKTTTKEITSNMMDLKRAYHILALVLLEGEDNSIYLDSSPIYLLERSIIEDKKYDINDLSPFQLSHQHIEELFSE